MWLDNWAMLGSDRIVFNSKSFTENLSLVTFSRIFFSIKLIEIYVYLQILKFKCTVKNTCITDILNA